MPAIGFGNTRILKLCAIDLEDASLIDFWDTETNASTYIARALATFPTTVKRNTGSVVCKTAAFAGWSEKLTACLSQNDGFIKSMRSAEGVLCEAGFELPPKQCYLFEGVKNKKACKSL